MLQIRQGVFETNSSSTHSITMCTQAEFDAWKNGELFFDDWTGKFVKEYKFDEGIMADAREEYEETMDMYRKPWNDLTDEARKQYCMQYIKDNDYDNECLTYDEYMDDYYLETFVNSYTTEHGDEIIAFGKYGYNG